MSPSSPHDAAEKPGLGKLYRALWRFAGEDRRRVVAFVALLLAAQAVRLAIPYLTGEAVNAMQTPGANGLTDAARYVVLIFLAALVGWVLHGPGRVLERFVAAGVRRRFTDALYAIVVGQPMAWHESHHSGDTIQRVEKSTLALFNFAQHQFVYLQNAVSLAGPLIAMFILSPPTGTVALVGYVVIAATLVRFDARMVRLNREENAAERLYTAALVDCLGNIATVLTLRLQKATQAMLGRRLDAVFRPLRQGIVVNEAKWCAIDLLNNGLRCFLVVFYAWLAWRADGLVMLGSAVMIFQYAQQIGGVVGSMAGNYQELVRYQIDFASADPLLGSLPARESAAIVPPDWREIAVSGLGFAYAGQDEDALAEVSLTLRRGGRIALVGASGSGKSTLLRLLAGHYAPSRGAFAIDGTFHPHLHDLRAIAMLVPQDPEIFESSIGQNVTMGVEHDPAAIRRALEIAGFTPVLTRLPHGLETHIKERGVNLSGGEKQRLALARGILAAAASSLVMLDEPTSSLDPETEAGIYDRLLASLPDACIVSAVHRLHLLPRFDTIVLLKAGRIVDAGGLRQLLARQPAFRALWQSYTEAEPREPMMAEA